MSPQSSHVAGAEAPQRLNDPALQDRVASLLHLSMKERDNLSSYEVNTCNPKLQKQVEYLNHSTGKPELTILDLLVQNAVYQVQLSQLQNSCQAALQDSLRLRQEARCTQTEISRLREDNARLQENNTLLQTQVRAAQDEISRLRDDWAQMQEDIILLRAQIRPVQAEDRCTHVSQVSTVADRFGQESPDQASNPEEGPLSGNTSRTMRFPHVRSPPREQVKYARAQSGISGFGPSSTSELYTSHSSRHLDRTPTPLQREKRCPHRHDDLSDHGDSDDSDGPAPPRRLGMRVRQLESLAEDIEHFDPSSKESNIDNYLREVEHCLRDLPHATTREKLKLVWKTTARSVHVFMETLPPKVRDSYSALCQTLREEYSLYINHASATLNAFSIMQKKHEPPRKYYRRLRAAYFQGRNQPGLEEDPTFKSLFIHNLHESVRYHVTVHCRMSELNMQEIRRYAQLAWETRACTDRWHKGDARVLTDDLVLEGKGMPRTKVSTRPGPQRRRPPRQQGRRHNQGGGDQTHSQSQTQPRQQTTSQPRQRVRSRRNPKQKGNHRAAFSNPSREEGLTRSEIESLIQSCLKERMAQSQVPSSSEGPVTGPPSA